MDQRKIQLPFSLTDCKTFQVSLHYKEGKDGKKMFMEFYDKETVEHLVITMYSHYQIKEEDHTPVTSFLNHLSNQSSKIEEKTNENESVSSDDSEGTKNKEQQKYRQVIEMKFIEF
jgi:hypothetical protein